jgi:hypothetical protein
VPRTAITAQPIGQSGVTPTYEAANVLGNSYALVPNRVIHVKNGGGSSINVTIPSTQTVEGLAVPTRTIAVPNDAIGKFISLGASGAHRQTDGSVNIDYSAVTSVTVAVLDVI